jgi:hypothetical protein
MTLEKEGFTDTGGWDATRQRQVLVWASATPDQRLAWLDDAIRLAWSTGALPRRRPDPLYETDGR